MKKSIYVSLVLGLVGLATPVQAQEVWVPGAPAPVVSYYAPYAPAYPYTSYYAPAYPYASYYVPSAPAYYPAPYVVRQRVVVPRRVYRNAYYAW